jgi:hypothetical protein
VRQGAYRARSEAGGSGWLQGWGEGATPAAGGLQLQAQAAPGTFMVKLEALGGSICCCCSWLPACEEACVRPGCLLALRLVATDTASR